MLRGIVYFIYFLCTIRLGYKFISLILYSNKVYEETIKYNHQLEFVHSFTVC